MGIRCLGFKVAVSDKKQYGTAVFRGTKDVGLSRFSEAKKLTQNRRN